VILLAGIASPHTASRISSGGDGIARMQHERKEHGLLAWGAKRNLFLIYHRLKWTQHLNA
jgi:hypothetical protein